MRVLTCCIVALVPLLATAFVVPHPHCSSSSSSSSWALLYQHERTTSSTEQETTERAKNCIEHFGECSIEELEELQSTLSHNQDVFNLANHNLQASRRLEHDIEHQLVLLKAHDNGGAFFINDDEPALVERVRECVEDFGECSLAELENLQTSFHEMTQSTPDLFQQDPTEQAWLDEGLALQVRLLKEHDTQQHYAKVESSSSLYPESPLLDRARLCTEEFGECSLDELEDLYTSLDQKGELKDGDASEKKWLQDGLALQLKIRETDLAKPATHKRKHHHKRVYPTTDSSSSSSLYPEVPIVNEARACAENFGQCTLEELLSVQRRLEEMIKVFESFDGMDLFDDESEQKWIQDGLALQIKCLKERGVESEITKPKEEEEIYFLYPEVGAIDRARDCADEFGKCSIEEMQDLIPTLQQHRKMAAAHDVYVDKTDTAWLDADEMQWLGEGLELQIALREKSRKETMKYDHLT